MPKDSLDTVVGFLNYLESSSTRASAERIESLQLRGHLDARARRSETKQALDTAFSFRKVFEEIKKNRHATPNLRYLQATLLLNDLQAFDDSALPDLQSRDYVLKLTNEVEALLEDLYEEVGDEGHQAVYEYLALPPAIHSHKRVCVHDEALRAAGFARLGFMFGLSLLWLSAILVIYAAWLAMQWDSAFFVGLIDGERAYEQALTAAVVGIIAFGAIFVLRYLGRRKAIKTIDQAVARVELGEQVPLLNRKQSMRRLQASMNRRIRDGFDQGPYSIESTSIKGMEAEIAELEQRLDHAASKIYGD